MLRLADGGMTSNDYPTRHLVWNRPSGPCVGFPMIRYLRMWVLRFRAGWIEGQIEHGEAMMLDHKERLANCYAQLRRIRAAESMVTPASTLLEQALRRKA